MPKVHSTEKKPFEEFNKVAEQICWNKAPGNLTHIKDGLKTIFGPRDIVAWRQLSKEMAKVDGTFIVGGETMEFYARLQSALNSAFDDQGNGILHALIGKGDEDRAYTGRLFLQFLRAGVDITMTDSRGRTAAHHACYNGEWNFCKLLLLSRANFRTIIDSDGRTPLDALLQHNESMGKELSKGAKEVLQMIRSEKLRPSLAELAANEAHWPALLNIVRTGAISKEEVYEEHKKKTVIGWFEELKGIKEEAEFRFCFLGQK